MASVLQEWKVLPHGKVTAIGDNIRTVVGAIHLPVGEFPRRMTVVKLNDGRLVIFNGIALDADEMLDLERWGRPAYLIVPNHLHRMDAKIWKDRYPDLEVLTPAGAREKVEEVVRVDATSADFGDPAVKFIAVAGTQEHEAALEITGSNGATLVLNDIVGNIHDRHGFSGWLIRMMGFAGDEAQIPAIVKAAIIDNKTALREQLLRWSQLPQLRQILVSHGETIDKDPGGTLRDLAESLH